MMMLALLLPLLQEPSTPPAAPAIPQPDASELLLAIASAQYAGHAGREVKRFGIELGLREFGETPHEYGFGLSYSTTGGESLTLQIDDPERGNRVRKGWDGKRHWLQENEGPLQDLGAREFDQDRQSIDEAIELSADLMLMLDYATLARRATELTLSVGPEQRRVLSGKVQRREHSWEFVLVLPDQPGALGLLPDALLLRQLNPDPLTRAERPVLLERHIAFSGYKRFNGRAVPVRVDEFLPEDELPARTLELYDLRWEDAALTPVKGALEVSEG